MADAIGNKAAKDYHLDIPAANQGFFAKGLGNTDWGFKNRIARMFNPESGNTVMLAFDHGYIMGSTAGLERLDVSITVLPDSGLNIRAIRFLKPQSVLPRPFAKKP